MSQAAIRRSSSYLIGYLFKNSKLYLVDEASNMIATLIILLSDPDSSTVTVSFMCTFMVDSLDNILFNICYFIRFRGNLCQGSSVQYPRRYFLRI